MCSRSKHSDGLERCTADVIEEGPFPERALVALFTDTRGQSPVAQVLVIVKCTVTGVLRYAVNVVLLGFQ